MGLYLGHLTSFPLSLLPELDWERHSREEVVFLEIALGGVLATGEQRSANQDGLELGLEVGPILYL